MEDLKSFLTFIQLIINRHGKKLFFAWLDEYFRDHPLPTSNSNVTDPLALLNSTAVCKLISCNRHHLYRLIAENKIRATRKGNSLLFRRKDIQEYIDKEFDD